MSIRKKLFKGGAALSLGQAAGQACSFGRNIIVARLVSPEDFGIAATFVITFQSLEMISNLSPATLLIQAKDGDSVHLQRTAHLMQALRGTLIALILFSIAGPVSRLFDVPQTQWAFRCLALIPFLRGFENLDAKRYNRQMRFVPLVSMEFAAQFLPFLLAWPLAIWLGDYSTLLWLLILQAAAWMTVSQIVADRRYGWLFDVRDIKRFFSFGWPLLINGLLMFGIFHGDRLIIGAKYTYYTMFDLGVYSVAFLLTWRPTIILVRIVCALTLPILSKVKDIPGQFTHSYKMCSLALSIMAAFISALLIISGGKLVTLVYGKEYEAASAFVGWLAAMQAIRLLRAAPTVAAIAKGDTRNSMKANMVRMVGILGALAAGVMGLPLTWVAASGFVGELFALGMSLELLRRQHGIAILDFLQPATLTAIAMLMATLALNSGISEQGWLIGVGSTSVITIVILMCAFVVFPEFRKEINNSFNHLRRMAALFMTE